MHKRSTSSWDCDTEQMCGALYSVIHPSEVTIWKTGDVQWCVCVYVCDRASVIFKMYLKTKICNSESESEALGKRCGEKMQAEFGE